MSTFIDITRPLHPGTPPWPGDRHVDFHFASRIRDGGIANVGNLAISLHNGTHADAPYHYNDLGITVEQVPVDTYIGPAQVFDVRGFAQISIDLLQKLGGIHAPRILFRSGAWSSPDTFPTDWSLLDLDVPQWLSAQGVKLIGLDAPSVDEPTSQDLPRHLALDRAQIYILENLLLDEVTPGNYELIALPLRLKGADGSPIRAVLRVDSPAS